jgi:hypothetical protein
MSEKVPNLVIYWADTKSPLTHLERKNLELDARVVSLTPREVLLDFRDRQGLSRKVVVCGLGAPGAPDAPFPHRREGAPASPETVLAR